MVADRNTREGEGGKGFKGYMWQIHFRSNAAALESSLLLKCDAGPKRTIGVESIWATLGTSRKRFNTDVGQ